MGASALIRVAQIWAEKGIKLEIIWILTGSIIPMKKRLRRSSELMAGDPYTLYVATDAQVRRILVAFLSHSCRILVHPAWLKLR